MADLSVPVDGLTAGILRMATATVKADEEAVVRNVTRAGRKAAGLLRSGATCSGGRPAALTGGYRAGWRSKTERRGSGTPVCTVYNARKPGLTHLLEMGHAKFVYGRPTGGRVPGYKHIEPAYERAKGEMLP